MKKIFILFAICSLGISFMSCNNSDSKKLAELQSKLDSIALEDSLRQAELKQKELAKAEWDQFTTTSDLNTFNLKGHVKTVTYLSNDGTECYKKLQFSIDGKLEKIVSGSLNKNYVIKRNKKGQITEIRLKDSWEGGDEGESYKYDASGYLCYISEWCSDTREDYYTKYNKDHWPTKATREGGGDGVPIIFSYPLVDDYGNWTSRKVSYETYYEEYVEKRTITYYEFQ